MILKLQKHRFNLKEILFSSILLLLANCFLAQKADLEKYIPYPELSEELHPEITVRVHVHIIKKSERDPQNITADSVVYLERMFMWINSMYKNMAQPSLKAKDGNIYHIPDSRIRFRLDTILTHVDSLDWDRIRTDVYMQGGAPWTIDSVNLETNEIGFYGGNASRINKYADSLKIIQSNGNDGVYRRKKARKTDGMTFIQFKEPLSSAIASGKVTYYAERDRNCSPDLWQKYTNSDRTALHVFYTGSSKVGNSFGCGPSPYYLNVSNLLKGGGYAISQLSGHELGHCLGLSHTDRPQFDDLPAKDKFGWIKCNNTSTSNNIMGYNTCRHYLSPKQIGHVHQRYTSKPEYIRTTTANEYDTAFNIIVRRSQTWDRAVVSKGDIVVKPGRTLTITQPVHMAEGAGVYLEKGAKLIVDNTVITNFFEGAYWNGVVVCKSYWRKDKKPKKKKDWGAIELKGDGKIEKVVGE